MNNNSQTEQEKKAEKIYKDALKKIAELKKAYDAILKSALKRVEKEKMDKIRKTMN